MPPLPFIRGFSDFVSALLSAGFSLGGGNGDGIFSVVSWAWDEAAPYDSPVRWHTGDPETDPWEWRVRVIMTALPASCHCTSCRGQRTPWLILSGTKWTP